jgi:hypothetical protein
MLISTVGLRSEKDSASDAQQKLKTTDQTSRQRGCPISSNRQLGFFIKKVYTIVLIKPQTIMRDLKTNEDYM